MKKALLGLLLFASLATNLLAFDYTFAWDAPDPSEGGEPLGYNLYVSVNGGQPVAYLADTVEPLTLTISGFNNGHQYYIWATSYNIWGESDRSNVVFIDTRRPGKPKQLHPVSPGADPARP